MAVSVTFPYSRFDCVNPSGFLRITVRFGATTDSKGRDRQPQPQPTNTMQHPTTPTDLTLRSRYLLAMAPAAVAALPLAAWKYRERLRAILAGEAGPTAAADLQATLDRSVKGK